MGNYRGIRTYLWPVEDLVVDLHPHLGESYPSAAIVSQLSVILGMGSLTS